MGIKGLTKLLADNAPNAMKERKLESYFGRRIAVVASMSIYQFLVVVGRKGTQTLTNEAGEVTSHLQGMFYRTIRLLEAGIKSVYVFDGPPPDLKKKELAKRECKRLLRLIGVPVVEATSEAEAQCAARCKAGKVYAVASEDMDSLTFGAPKFLRHLMDPSSRKVPVMEFEISKEMNLDMDQFIDLCILSGCDYFIGGLTALKVIHRHGSIENIVENIKRQRCFLCSYLIPDNWPYSEARLLFKESVASTEEQPEIKWTAANEEGLISFLVNENGFNIDRVTKVWLFSSVMCWSVAYWRNFLLFF
ncbi:hypothetical protein EUGRSUZ_B01835 [Eucalyptus grandis]|uniref:Uncharacterized protein n=1 Tax=Eucalyptus grandis TaxID=71139 RepID=A0ACC3LSL5_EUCGR|nr:hypothetical protein EUGRSUZ_B01835 [Eucalyptus grandis]